MYDRSQFAITESTTTFAVALKKILSIFLVFTIISQTLVNIGIGVYYHLNKASITQKLCENRNNPKLHCNGHCYLSKQLKKAEEGENKSAKLIREKEEIISNQISALPLRYFPHYSATKIHLQNFTLYCSGNNQSLLKPPTV